MYFSLVNKYLKTLSLCFFLFLDKLLKVEPYCFLQERCEVDLRLFKRNHLDLNFLGYVENEIVLLIKIAFLQILVTY